MNGRPRLFLLDLIRGLTLLSMIAYHASYDLVYLYGLHIPGYTGTPGYIWQQSICWSFLFLSGFCFHLGDSRPGRQFCRGLLLSACGLIITLATAVFMPSSLVLMGVLSFYGLAAILTALLQPYLERIPASAGLVLSVLLFLLTRNVPSGSLGFESFTLLTLPRWLYANPVTMILGFPYPGFYSTDYFSLLPWIFLFLAGYYCWNLFFASSEKARKLLAPSFCPPVQFIGRHTLLIYMLHQPVLMGIFTLLRL